MKKIAKSAFLVATVVCAVAIGRMVNKGFRSGLPDAVVGVSHAHAAVPAAASEVAGVVSRVCDGDTIWVEDAKGLRHKIRMLDIDAPESSQEFGGESTARLKSLIGGKQVKVTYTERDKYGRILGTVWFGGEDINLRMVAEGMAWRYHYSRNERYAAAQDAARTLRIGLWADPNAQDPWAYRKGMKQQGATQQVARQGQAGSGSTQAAGGYFSGNRVEYRAGNEPVASRTSAPVCDKWPDTGFWLSTNSMKRHNRGCENYRKTRGYPCRKDEGSPCGKCGG